MRPFESYKTLVARRTSPNPCLQDLSSFLSRKIVCQRAFRAVCMEFFTENRPPYSQRIDLNSLTSLLSNTRKGSNDCCGRILIIEDPCQDVVEILGSMLDIDPLFFASHIDTHEEINMTTARPSVTTLPSTARSQNFLNLHYQRVIQCDNPRPRQTLLRNMNLRRKVKMLPQTGGITIGLVRHCCSILETIGPDGLRLGMSVLLTGMGARPGAEYVLGLILVDAPISNSDMQIRQPDKRNTRGAIQACLFKGGFQDIRPISATFTPDEAEMESLQGSPLETLLSCWKHDKPWESNANGPLLFSLAHHPLRMVAAEWMIYLELMFHSIKQYEYRPDTMPVALDHITALHADIHSLQRWLRRSMSTSQKIRYVIRFLRRSASPGSSKYASTSLIEDYEEIASMIDSYTHRLETTISVATSLIQAFDCRRSLTETKNISRLTVLALGFIPLTFVTGLFSMNERVAPGGSHFWLYFAVAVPLCVAVFLVTRLTDRFVTSLSVKAWKSRRITKSMA